MDKEAYNKEWLKRRRLSKWKMYTKAVSLAAVVLIAIYFVLGWRMGCETCEMPFMVWLTEQATVADIFVTAFFLLWLTK